MRRAPTVGVGVRVTVGVLAVVAVAGGAAVGGYAVAGAARSAPSTTARPSPAPPRVLASAGSTPGPTATPTATVPPAASVSATLRAAAGAGVLGGDLHAEVATQAGTRVVYARAAGTPVAPASTAKLLTATALLSVHADTDRLTTTVRTGTRTGDVVLVGGGDPTLAGAAAGHATRYPQAARISDLAAAVRRAGVPVRRVVVDDSAFAGPTVSPAWAAEDVPSDYGSAITAVMVDGGRATPDAVQRSTTPDLDAGHALAAALGRSGLPVVRGRAPAAARVLGTVRSAPLSVLVEQMLHLSDNVVAECLGRVVAQAEHAAPTFTGAAAAIRAVLRRATGVDVGAGMVDASGLARRDRLTAATLVDVLRAATDQDRLHDVITGLPVAGWSGSLGARYVSGASRAGAGLVRAKTGTLTGVSALAGLVHDRSGALLLFALVTNRAGDIDATEAALDTLATRLAGT